MQNLQRGSDLQLKLVAAAVETVCACSVASRAQLSSTPWTRAHQAPLPMEFSKQEYWSGLPFPPPGDLPNPGIKAASLALAGRFFTAEPPGKPVKTTSLFVPEVEAHQLRMFEVTWESDSGIGPWTTKILKSCHHIGSLAPFWTGAVGGKYGQCVRWERCWAHREA